MSAVLPVLSLRIHFNFRQLTSRSPKPIRHRHCYTHTVAAAVSSAPAVMATDNVRIFFILSPFTRFGPLPGIVSREETVACVKTELAITINTVLSSQEKEHDILICGAGIIGSAIAYYLAEKGVKSTVVEKGDVACASSGNFSCPHNSQLDMKCSNGSRSAPITPQYSVITGRCTSVQAHLSRFQLLWPTNLKAYASHAVPQTRAGKAGGFLALDWNDSSPVGPLARLSYALHQELAKSLGEDTGYREVRTFSVTASAKPGARLSCNMHVTHGRRLFSSAWAASVVFALPDTSCS